MEYLELAAWIIGICFVAGLVSVRLADRERDRLRVSLSAENPPLCKTDQRWRKPFNRYLDGLKADIEEKEKKLREAELDAIILKRSSELSFFRKVGFHFSVRSRPLTEVSAQERAEYEALCEKIDRLWSGDAGLERSQVTLEIELAKHADANSAKLIRLRHDLADIEELIQRAKDHPDKVIFDDHHSKRWLDLQDEIVESLELPVEKEIERVRMYTKLMEKITLEPGLSKARKDELLRKLDSLFEEQQPEPAKPRKPVIPIYKKEA